MTQIIQELKKLTKHSHIELTSRGNTAIFAALYCARKQVLDEKNKITRKAIIIPDQGGWLTYEKYSQMLELGAKKVKTDYGIIDLNELEKLSKDACALIYSNPAGYFAEQPIKEIYEICRKNGCLVILDVTGCIGDADLCDGEYADFTLCSFGRWKPVNVGYGGFVSAQKKEYFDKAKEIFKTTTFDDKYFPLLEKKLLVLKKRMSFFYGKAEKVKGDLKDFDVIHKDKKGINVVVRFKDDKERKIKDFPTSKSKDIEEKEKIINYCKTNNLEYTLCPRYIRVRDNAISIEIKRLDIQ